MKDMANRRMACALGALLLAGPALAGEPCVDARVGIDAAHQTTDYSDAVRAAAKEVIRPDALTWIVVGDLKKIEEPVRKLGIGKVEVIDADGKVMK